MVIPSFTRQQILVLSGIFIGLLGIFIWLLTKYISPAPPSRVEMTTGAVDGASHQFALKYQAYLQANRVTLQLKPSTGSVQNLERLSAGTPIGFVQGGLGILSIDPQKSDEDTALRSLGVVGYEPIWLFAPSGELSKKLALGLDILAGKTVAIGAEGSGTRKVALDLLQSYGVTAANATFSADGGMTAAEIAQASTNLDPVEQDISEMKFSLDFTDRIYTLRQHVDYVRIQLQKEKDGLLA